MTEALIGLGLMMVLALLRIPIAIAMGVVGFLGVAYLRDWNFAPAMAMVETKVYETGRNYTLSVVPLFILMGNFVTRAGMSQELFRAAYTFVGHLRGGLAMATICACAGFGAICGSSIATAATMAKVAYPSMKELGYSDRLSTGAIAAGGTLGILIPPSTLMVIYGVMTETNIGKLFAAGILPGILATFLLCLAVQWTVLQGPGLGSARRKIAAGASGCARSKASGPSRCCSSSSWAASMAACSPPPKARASAPSARCASRSRGARCHGATLLDALVEFGAHHGDAVRHPDRRADVRRIRQLHDDAERPEDAGHHAQPVADHGDHGDLRHLRASSAPRWKSCR